MARRRMISVSLDGSEKLAKARRILKSHNNSGNLAWAMCHLYQRLVVRADDFGRGSAQTWDIKNKIFFDQDFPVTDAEINLMLQSLHESKIIKLYEVDEKFYYEIWNFASQQGGLHKKTKSEYPELPKNSHPINLDISTQNENIPGNSGKFRANRIELNRIESNRIYIPPSPLKSKKDLKTEFTDDFHMFWDNYPRQIEKQKTFKNWKTLLKAGHKPDDLIQSAKNYAEYCRIKKTEDKFIKHPSTFLGPDEPFKDFLDSEQFQKLIKSAKSNSVKTNSGCAEPSKFSGKGGILTKEEMQEKTKGW